MCCLCVDECVNASVRMNMRMNMDCCMTNVWMSDMKIGG